MKQLESKWDADLYNQKHAFVFDYGESLIDLLDPQVGERILDVGCGAGQLTAKIGEKAGSVTGIDNSPEMVASARAQFPAIDFRVGDAADFQVERAYDAIFSNAALHWVLAYQKAIACMYQSLRQGGRLVVELGGKGNIQSIERQLKESLQKRGYATQAALTLWYFPSLSAYTTTLESAGFEVSFAQLYDRPTELADEQTGIKDWLKMFGSRFFASVSAADVEAIQEEVQEKLKPTLFREGTWYADYRRLRVVAWKK